VISSCHKYHSRAHDKTQAPHARRSRAFTAPKSTRRDSCRPYPGGSGHVGWRACPSASACRLLSGSGSRPACAGGGVLSPRSPRARVGDNTEAPVPSALASGSQVSRTKMPPKPLLEPRPDAAPIGYPKKPIDGSPLGGYAKRPPPIPSLNLNSAIVRTTIRGSAVRRATYADPRRRPRSRDCREVPRSRRKSINLFKDLKGKQMSDNTRLSGIAATQPQARGSTTATGKSTCQLTLTSVRGSMPRVMSNGDLIERTAPEPIKRYPQLGCRPACGLEAGGSRRGNDAAGDRGRFDEIRRRDHRRHALALGRRPTDRGCSTC
jgi:hypothetical protein